MAGKKTKTVDLTTGIGTFSFPRVFATTKTTKDSDGSDQYDIQFLIPKTQRDDCRAIMAAVKAVGIDAFGDPGWKAQRIPFRDGDKEANGITTDGSTNAEKYPERLGHYFFNARTSKPVGVYDRNRNIITNPDDLYGGSKGKVAITVYAYNNNGNAGVGFSLNGVQKIADGESFGGGRPAVESMFDIIDAEDDLGLDDDLTADEPVAEPPAAAKPALAKKTGTAKKAEAPAPVTVEDDDDDLVPDDGDATVGDEYDDL